MLENMLQDITNNRLLLILLEERIYERKLGEIIKFAGKKKTRTCYVCLSRPYTDVVSELGGMGVNTDHFFFIDVLTSHYTEPEPVKNCMFLSSPADLAAVKDAITYAIDKNKCSVLLFDTISTLLAYQQTDSIVKFTNSIVSEKAGKLFLVLKNEGLPYEDIARLTKDLEMFADKKLDLTESIKIKE